MRASDLSRVTWLKSSRSNDVGDGACVEVAELSGWVAMRNSRDPAGPILAFNPAEWRAFLGNVEKGEFG